MIVWVKRLLARLAIWTLGLLQRLVKTRGFQLVVILPIAWTRVLYRLTWLTFTVLFGRIPNELRAIDPEIAESLNQIERARQAPITGSIARYRTVTQSITWGLAGVGVVILTTIVTGHMAIAPAILVATACFSLSVPFLVIFGVASAFQAEGTRPTVHQTLVLQSLIFVAHLIFYVGFAAFLWSFDARISVVFIISCYLAWRFFRRFVSAQITSQGGDVAKSVPEPNRCPDADAPVREARPESVDRSPEPSRSPQDPGGPDRAPVGGPGDASRPFGEP
jgi:hypothetical protein